MGIGQVSGKEKLGLTAPGHVTLSAFFVVPAYERSPSPLRSLPLTLCIYLVPAGCVVQWKEHSLRQTELV